MGVGRAVRPRHSAATRSKVGKYEGRATEVGDVDSNGLAKLIANMNAGTLAAGEALAQPTGFLSSGPPNPLVDKLEKLESKLEAGVGLFQRNIVYDVERFARGGSRGRRPASTSARRSSSA